MTCKTDTIREQMSNTASINVSRPASPLEALFEVAGVVALHLDCEGKVTFVSQARSGVERLAEQLKPGADFIELFEDEVRDDARAAVKQALQTPGRLELTLPLRNELGAAVRWMLCSYLTGNRQGLLAVAYDLTSERQAELKLSHTSLYDGLTGLPNRALLQDRCDHAIALAQRQELGFTLALIDLSGLKKVNDGLGVRFGDQLLQLVGKRLVSNLRASDTVARIGSDEFALVLPDVVHPRDMARMGEQLISALEAPYSLGEHTVHIGASMGFAIYPGNGADFAELLAAADQALREARHAGSGRCVMYSPRCAEDAMAALSLEAALHDGVRNGEMYLDYQPLVTAAGDIYGVEALMRWKRGGTAFVSPAQFIPIAESSGLIHLLGAWALKAATFAIAQFNRTHDVSLQVSVNVSPRQFRGAQFMRSVEEALRVSQLPPENLQLEITEGTLMTDPEAAAALLDRLAGMGVKIAVDDFGTGYSSLAYLKRFNLSTLKVDRSFVKDLPNAKDLAICRSVFSLANDLGLKSVAEGVETVDQWLILRAAGCAAIQGYLFGKPQSLATLSASLNNKFALPAAA